MTSATEAKERIAREIRDLNPRLLEVSHYIHANPEIGFQEHKAVSLLTLELQKEGFAIQRPVAGLDTAFVASYGSGKPVVAFMAEYDALRGLDHACGHNLIATWALGAAIALKRSVPDLKGTIQMIGTPAEEGGGGKVVMVNEGVFRGVDAAIMMHGNDAFHLHRPSLAVAHYTLEFFGKSAHASASPEKGISALDAVLQVFFSVNAWRQMLKPGARIHGCILKGGDAPNIIPEYASAEFLVRAAEQDYHAELKKKFRNIVEAACLSTGARVEIHEGLGYDVRVSNQELLDRFRDNLVALGIQPEDLPPDAGIGSSDVANVSQVVPTIHPFFKVCDKGVPAHTPEMRAAVGGPQGDATIGPGATVMAWTGADVLLDPGVWDRLRATFRQQLGRDPQEW